MNFSDLDRDPELAYWNPALPGSDRLVFRSNRLEPVLVRLDEAGQVDAEFPAPWLYQRLPDGWEAAVPLPATGRVRDDSYRDPAEQPPDTP
jgi:hypothetical protein